MIAAAVFNERRGIADSVAYGCVTTAYEWVFLRLYGTILDINILQRYSPEKHSLPYLLGVMQHIVEQFIE